MKTVKLIEAKRGELEKLSDAELRAKTDEFRAMLKEGKTLDDLLVDALAAVREGAFRAIGQRAYPVQLAGAVVLHQGRIAELKTGEGKTLTAALAAYLNALPGEGVHVVTVNDYLAKYHSEWMGKIYRFMGMQGVRAAHEAAGSAEESCEKAQIDPYETLNLFKNAHRAADYDIIHGRFGVIAQLVRASR